MPSIVIDDGEMGRSRRGALMSQRYGYVGLAVHQHEEFDYELIVVLANEIRQKSGEG